MPDSALGPPLVPAPGRNDSAGRISGGGEWHGPATSCVTSVTQISTPLRILRLFIHCDTACFLLFLRLSRGGCATFSITLSADWEKQPDDLGFETDAELEEQWLAEWEEADRHAVEILRNALRRYRRKPPPAEQLSAAAAAVRTSLDERGHPLAWVRQAAGLSDEAAQEDDAELLIRLAAATISPMEETGLDLEQEALLMSLEPADWLGAIVSAVREGDGADASPDALVDGIRNCPEVTVDPELDTDDESHVVAAFWIVALPWHALGITDRDQRLTELGVWILPRALARAWNGEFDRVSDGPD